MGTGSFSRFWSSTKGWDYHGRSGSWTFSRGIINLNGDGTSGQIGHNALNFCGALFPSHAVDGRIRLRLTSTNKEFSYERSAVVPYNGDIRELSPVPSIDLEIAFPTTKDAKKLPKLAQINNWNIEINATGLDLPHHKKKPMVEGWFGVFLMVS